MKSAPEKNANRLTVWLPVVFIALSLAYLLSSLRMPESRAGYDLKHFGQLPVVDRGRPKPMDTLARTSLLVLAKKQSLWSDGRTASVERDDVPGGKRMSATHWLLDVMAKPDESRHYKVIRIDHPDILSLLGFPNDRKFFSFHEIMQHRAKLAEQIDRARAVSNKDRDLFQRKLMDLSQHLGVFFTLSGVQDLYVVPPPHDGAIDQWRTFGEAQHHFDVHGVVNPAAQSFLKILEAWHDAKAVDFNAAVIGYHTTLRTQVPRVMGKSIFESFFNQTAPFIHAIGLSVLVFLLVTFSWLVAGKWSIGLNRAAFWVMVLALVVQTLGLVARIYIQGRPPVTNLYSSAIFVGWGCAILGIILERMFRNGIGSLTAAVTGFLSLLVAHNLSLDGDTMTMMQAVLDTNFWLATHVVVITLGYSAVFLAGFLGILYIFAGVFTRALTPELGRSLTRMIYGITCFAVLFSFAGTILGGIWADQSWGRFWGWDPKENGAVLIVLWTALVLHARWGGLIKGRGLAVLAVGGNIVTSWSWFGTNMLGVGLHSYGFMDSAIFWLMAFVFSQLLIMAVGLLPMEYWRSFRTTAARKTGRDSSTLGEPAAAK